MQSRVAKKDGYKITLEDLQFCARNVLHIVANTIKKEKERGLWCSNCCDSAVGTCTFRKIFCVFVYSLLVILWYKY